MFDKNRQTKSGGYYIISTTLTIIMLGMLTTCADKATTQMEKIKNRGEIIVVTRNGPASYYIEKNTDTGPEYVLAKRFADKLGVNLKVIIAKNAPEVKQILNNEQADFAAAALINSQPRDNALMYGPAYQWVTQQLVYRNGRRQPSSLDDIFPDKLDLSADTLALLPLEQLQRQFPQISWNTHADRDSHEMLELLENNEILYTITDSNELTLARQYYPEIRVAFNVTPPQPVAWAFRKSDDLSLLQAVWRFYEEITRNGELAELIDEFYTPEEKFDYLDARKFIDRYQIRFVPLQALFEKIGHEENMDWVLLAAISYQESHWDEEAVTAAGMVKGLMMLKRETANSVGVKNRSDPEQSIRGGAIYLKNLMQTIPEHVSEPDRTWMAVASYNVGYGHVEDARVLTQRQGGDPDKWEDVKKRLPLLSRKEWYEKTKSGYARGVEPLMYVERISKYYNTLVQLSQPDTPAAPQAEEQLVESGFNYVPVLP